MFYSIQSRNSRRNRVTSLSDDLARAFALTGLIRVLDDSVPDDLAYLYVDQTDVSGLDRVMRDSVVENKKPFVPNGVREMAKSYLGFAVNWQVSAILDDLMFSAPRDGRRWLARTYPQNFRLALRALVLPTYADFEDVYEQINGLYAALIPASSFNGYGDHEIDSTIAKRENFGLLNDNEDRTLWIVRDIMVGYIRRLQESKKLPPASMRAAYANAIDLLLVLFGPGDIISTLTAKRIYDFARLGKVMTGPNAFTNYATRLIEREYTMSGGYCYPANVSGGLDEMKLFSPQAAICYGIQSNCEEVADPEYVEQSLVYPSSGFGKIPHDILKLNTNPVHEVALYMTREYESMRHRLKAIGDEKARTGTTTNGCRCVPCEDAPCRCECDEG